MKIYYLLLLIPLFILSSCLSIYEQDAINELTKFYGGKVIISKGLSFNTSNGSGKAITLAVENEHYQKGEINPVLMSSNYAFTFYKNMDSSERSSYDKIVVQLKDDTTYTYEISMSDLAVMKKEYDFIYKWVYDVKEKKIESSYQYLNTSLPAMPIYKEYIISMDSVNNEQGTFNDIIFNGVSAIDVNDKVFTGKLHTFLFYCKAEKKPCIITVSLNPKDLEYKVYGFNIRSLQ